MLILVPTPIDEETILEPTALTLIQNDLENFPESTLILVEDMKPARQRWVRWGLDRKYIEQFVLYNEHTRDELQHQILAELKAGKKAYLMSDGGLPAFCDPGVELVDLCHQNKIKVTSTPFSNSVSLAIALSGFSHKSFRFLGFPPQKSEDRITFFDQLKNIPETCILMDAPYRMGKTVEEIGCVLSGRPVFVAMDLNTPQELLLRGQVADIMKKLPQDKREFVIVVASRL